MDGEKTVTLKGDNIAAEFKTIVDDYVSSRFGEGGARRKSVRAIPIKAL